jgi:dihydrofolate reductase
VQTPGNGWPRLRWGGATPLLAFNAKTGVLDNLSAVQIERLSVVFDEGPDVGRTTPGRSRQHRRQWQARRTGPGPKSGNEDKESAEAFRTAGAPHRSCRLPMSLDPSRGLIPRRQRSEGAEMGKLVESTFVSLDGSIENPQNWSPPYWDDEHRAYASKLLWDADALLLGRKTYEGFAQAWPPRAGADEFTDRMNAMPKYVASSTLTETTWNATVLEGDTVEAIRTLKDEEGLNLLKFGTGELDRTLLDSGLVDEYHFWYFPVLAGGGQRLIDGIETTHLGLLDTATFKSGIVVHVLAPKRG